MPDLFISYSSKDQIAADAAVALLEARGFSCWIAHRDLRPGNNWGGSLIEGIESCRMFLLLFSQDANESPHVRREVERAVHKGLVIIPVRLEEVMPEKDMEYFISSQHWMDAFPEPFENYLDSLADAIGQFRDGSRSGADGTAAPRAVKKRKKPASVPMAMWTAGAGILAAAGLGWAMRSGDGADGDGNNRRKNAAEASEPVPRGPVPTTGVELTDEAAVEAGREVNAKLERIIVPNVGFSESSIQDAVAYLRMKAKEGDVDEEDADRKGVNILTKIPDGWDKRISVRLTNVTLKAALQEVAREGQLAMNVQLYMVLLAPVTEAHWMITKLYPLNAELLSGIKAEYRELVTISPALAGPGPAVFSLKRWLEFEGIRFAHGGTVTSNEDEQTMLVRAAPGDHALIGEKLDVMYGKHPGLVRPLIPAALISRMVPDAP